MMLFLIHDVFYYNISLTFCKGKCSPASGGTTETSLSGMPVIFQGTATCFYCTHKIRYANSNRQSQ